MLETTPVDCPELPQESDELNVFGLEVPFELTLEFLVNFHEKTGLPNGLPPDELRAVITHWMQSPEESPVFVESRLVKRWRQAIVKDLLPLGGQLPLPDAADSLRFDFSKIEPKLLFPAAPSFHFVDLFAGIGGFRVALQDLGGKCVFSSELDKAAKDTYFRNFGEVPFGDIRQFTHEGVSDAELKRLIPDHDILTAGFPCQPFSNAGVSARNSLGKPHGFECEIQGTLFYDIVRIARVKKPKVIFLENVRNLMRHDGGRTFKKIRETIENELGYSFAPQEIDAVTLVPQRRKRIYMVCYHKKDKKFTFPPFEGKPKALEGILEKDPEKVAPYFITDRLWESHIARSKRNLARGTGFTAFTVDPRGPSNTLVARYGKDGKECLIAVPGKKNPRMLTPHECARLQGFPKEFAPHEAKTPAYRQFGNSVAVPVIREIGKAIVEMLDSDK